MNLDYDLQLILLETGNISYTEYCEAVPEIHRPREYATLELFLRNKGKASKRLAKESEWNTQRFKNDNDL